MSGCVLSNVNDDPVGYLLPGLNSEIMMWVFNVSGDGCIIVKQSHYNEVRGNITSRLIKSRPPLVNLAYLACMLAGNIGRRDYARIVSRDSGMKRE